MAGRSLGIDQPALRLDQESIVSGARSTAPVSLRLKSLKMPIHFPWDPSSGEVGLPALIA